MSNKRFGRNSILTNVGARCFAALCAVNVSLFFLSPESKAGEVDSSQLVTDKNNYALPDIPMPGYLEPMIDPVFGTTIIRVTEPNQTVFNPYNHPSIDGHVWGRTARHHYSLDQAWNADMSLLMITKGISGSLFLDGQTYEPLFRLSNPGSHRWHPIDPDLQIYVDENDVGIWNVRTNSSTVIETLAGYSNFEFGPNKGNPTNDGAMLAIWATRNSDNKLVAFAYNLETGTKHPDIVLDEFGDDVSYVTMSPLGNYILIRGDLHGRIDERGDNTQIVDLDGNRIGSLWDDYGEPSHPDAAVDENGDEVLVGVAKSGTYKGYMIKRRLVDGHITPLIDAWGSHTSMRNLRRPGWAYVSYRDPSSSVFSYEIVGVRLDGSQAIERYGHTHAIKTEYLAEMHGSASPDGTRIVFASNWDGGDGDPIASYVIELPVTESPPPPDTDPETNNVPNVTITSTVVDGSAATFGGAASDAEDGDLTASMNWMSDLNGPLGNGGTVTVPTLSVGEHMITASATDSEAATGTDSTSVTVTSNADGDVIERRVAASSDDAEEHRRGRVKLTSSDLELITDKRNNQIVGMRFTGIDIPPNTPIKNAFIQLQADEVESVNTSLTIQGQKSGNAMTFTSAKRDISARPRTTGTVAWDPVPWTVRGDAGLDQRTPDIASIIEEIVAGDGWAAGNAVVIIVSGAGKRVAEAFDGDENGAPLLHIEY